MLSRLFPINYFENQSFNFLWLHQMAPSPCPAEIVTLKKAVQGHWYSTIEIIMKWIFFHQFGSTKCLIKLEWIKPLVLFLFTVVLLQPSLQSIHKWLNLKKTHQKSNFMSQRLDQRKSFISLWYLNDFIEPTDHP